MSVLDHHPETIVVRPEHLRFVRSLRVGWARGDAGAPSLSLLEDGASEAELLAKVRAVMGPVLLSDRATGIALYREGMLAAEAFVSHAALAPGWYEYEDPLGAEQLARAPFAKSDLVEIRGGIVRLEVTAAHLALLGRANVRFFDEGGLACRAGIDPQRPYGDQASFELDMAAILGLRPEGPPRDDEPGERELSEPQLLRLHELHHTTQPALQVLLRRGELRAMAFRRQPPGEGRWAPV